MPVYIEYVFLDNFVLDLLLLKAVSAARRENSRLFRQIIASLVGAAFAVAFPLFAISPIIKTILKLLLGAAVVLICFGGSRTQRSFFLDFFLFLLCSFAFGGTMLGLMSLFDLSTLISFGEFSFGAVMLAGYALYRLTVKIIMRLFRASAKNAFAYPCAITLGKKRIETSGFLDSGNMLFDSRSGLPVSVVSKKLALTLTDKSTRGRYIEATTISGRQKMLVFQADRLEIYNGEEVNTIEYVLLGVSGRKLKDCEIILNPSLWRSKE